MFKGRTWGKEKHIWASIKLSDFELPPLNCTLSNTTLKRRLSSCPQPSGKGWPLLVDLKALDDPRQSLLALERLLGSLPEEPLGMECPVMWWLKTLAGSLFVVCLFAFFLAFVCWLYHCCLCLFVTLTGLVGSLQEALPLGVMRFADLWPRQAKLIWWQFARYESELGYLRSVITSYEDVRVAWVEGSRK